MHETFLNNEPQYPNAAIGKVIIAGAGCGDPELITVKASRYLQQAEVVLIDRLVSKEIVDQYVNPEAIIIYVGKQCRKKLSTPQESINKLIIKYACQGKLVVRLKGGDVSFFSNMLDELACLKKHHVPYEIIPGITAASGAAAYAGIPLTARGLSAGVRFLTTYRPGTFSDSQWRELAATSDTLVFYMSSVLMDDVVDSFIKGGVNANKHLAVIEQATTPEQYIVTTTFKDYAVTLKGKKFNSPALAIVGDVVELHSQFAWRENHSTRLNYFDELESKLASIEQPEKKLKHVTRA
jgi:uroporphyrin-III C-methyltransferase/precorrin-2 dehydrogenase/sirohydrochlorin ferrochelatase/uroporphyrin-III C-methyltransferase